MAKTKKTRVTATHDGKDYTFTTWKDGWDWVCKEARVNYDCSGNFLGDVHFKTDDGFMDFHFQYNGWTHEPKWDGCFQYIKWGESHEYIGTGKDVSSTFEEV